MSAFLSHKTCASAVRIGDRVVGSGEPVFIVAEIGVNHDGDARVAITMVDAAVDAGADAVKFQMFHASSLATRTAPTASYQTRTGKPQPQMKLLAPLELSLDELASIKQHCDQRGVLFMATPFGEAQAAQLAGLGGAALKIASADLTNQPLLAAAIATQLPLIISTGASTVEEIQTTVAWLRSHGAADRLVLLHCVSCYPTSLAQINLRAIEKLAGEFDVPAGLSDHTLSTEVGGWAVASGACVLEKHMTLDNRRRGPDHAMSLTPDQLAAYIVRAREAERAMGSGEVGMISDELEVRTLARKSVVACADIPSGTLLTKDMLTLKRPGTGLPVSALEELTGRHTNVDITSDTLLAWDMVQ